MPVLPTDLRDLGSTRWSLVLAAGDRAAPESDEALESLCRTYWPPLYAFARRQVTEIHQAQDLTQAFFARLLEKNYLKEADPRRGRFRTFLLACFRHFLSKEWHKARALKRGGGLKMLSLDFDSGCTNPLELSDDLTPERIYDRQWAVTLTNHVVSLLQAEYEAAGKGRQFETLKPFLTGSPDSPGYGKAAEALGASPGAIRVAVHRLRHRYGERLRDEIAATVTSPEEIEDEIRALFDALGR